MVLVAQRAYFIVWDVTIVIKLFRHVERIQQFSNCGKLCKTKDKSGQLLSGLFGENAMACEGKPARSQLQ